VVAYTAFNCAVLPDKAWAVAPIAIGLQRAVPLLFGLLAAVAAAAHWRSDLVEGRRWLRGFVVISGVGETLAAALARIGAPQGRLSSSGALLELALLLLIVTVVAAQMLRWRDTDLFPVTTSQRSATAASPAEDCVRARHAPQIEQTALQSVSAVPTDEADEPLVAQLQQMMSEQRAYRTEDLTVAGLAARLNVPEYRLRRSINRRLGHRNFNAYVNGFRLADARAALADPAKRDLPILTIALDAGFQSIGPFNRAFKAATGLTPSDFRREKLADS
jgi:AraC-like DNA-binding protein